ncbi:MAG: hypothetical protein H7Z21_08375 [Hymenobacter sp.]|nr:hypothetical protein [Hymenobacter sp.]
MLRIVYLLFREGYYATSDNQVLRQDLCAEALRLGLLLADYPATDLPKTNALVALMCFHASRFRARTAAPVVLYDAQDEALWDQELIGRGGYYLARAAQGPELTPYHLEARIAYWHCQKADTPEKWVAVLGLYDHLLRLQYSPGAALNRTFALYKVHGPHVALTEARRLALDHQHFYHLLLGELQHTLDLAAARASFQTAFELAKTSWEKESIRARLEALG